MKLYLAVRAWVDRMLADYVNRMLLLPAFVVLLPGAFLRGWYMFVALALTAAWVGFVYWRAWRLFKTGIVDSDRSDWVEPK